MCRIFAAALAEGPVGPVLKAGLKRLEYGGYDSSGMAAVDQGKLQIKKGVGKLDEVDKSVKFDELPGCIGIAHNRWATHGYPSVTNAHPQIDCTGKIAVVHNGVIENFFEIKERLAENGHEFKSRTDTEVIAHLIEDYIKKGMDFLNGTINAMKDLRGSYALAILYSAEPNTVILVKNESPLMLGISDEGNYAASDAVAFVDHTNRIIHLEDGELAVITPKSYKIYRISDGESVNHEIETVDISVSDVDKGGYRHYMLKEIMEQPVAISYALNLQAQYLDVVSELVRRSRITYLIGAGSSYHSCMAGSYMLSQISGMPTIPAVASEFIQQFGKTLNPDSTTILASQSGETADVLKVASYARLKASTVISITNVVSSTITRLSRAYIVQQAGPEIGVAATKTYTTQLLVYYQLAVELARKSGSITEANSYMKGLHELPRLAEKVLEDVSEPVNRLAAELKDANHIFFLGRGINTATAYEGRLKMLEISYIPSSAFSAGESKHGPIALIENNSPVIFVAPDDTSRKVIMGNIMEIKARGGKAIVFGDENDSELKQASDEFIGMPQIDEMLSPIIYILPLQLLAYNTAILKGYDPDKPRNLAKSVTVL
ncbi:MAG: glutamine--fructose-6-phosphate transaminase (isomerizing) [Nitrososphaerota archaeon]|nr:glutamine--fructose-6-phosphate transaminase (isomerizing) [Nitrososphaerota archaeon]MDG6929636.1 glutamine--fructose-6-phosphate transaminase (isomerizing) [Nitrososphaerota archaeon]